MCKGEERCGKNLTNQVLLFIRYNSWLLYIRDILFFIYFSIGRWRRWKKSIFYKFLSSRDMILIRNVSSYTLHCKQVSNYNLTTIFMIHQGFILPLKSMSPPLMFNFIFLVSSNKTARSSRSANNTPLPSLLA